MDQVQMLQDENEALKAENAALRDRAAAINPVHAELVALLTATPMTVTELGQAMTRENRYVSQCLYQLKQRYGVNVITLSDGRKQIIDIGKFVMPK